MMTIKTTTWSDSGVEFTRLMETNGAEIIINRWVYNSYKQYEELAYEKFNNGEHPCIHIGEPPKNNNIAYSRELLWVSYYNPIGDLYTFVLNYGYLYVMQDGKTIDKYFIECPNKEYEKSDNPTNEEIKKTVNSK